MGLVDEIAQHIIDTDNNSLPLALRPFDITLSLDLRYPK